MSNDEVQKRMEFIIEQQAQFTVNIQKLEESQKKTDEQIGRLEGAFVGLFSLVVEVQEAQKRTVESLAKLTDRVNGLAESQAVTEERLNSMILVVEKYFSGKQNGNHPEHG